MFGVKDLVWNFLGIYWTEEAWGILLVPKLVSRLLDCGTFNNPTPLKLILAFSSFKRLVFGKENQLFKRRLACKGLRRTVKRQCMDSRVFRMSLFSKPGLTQTKFQNCIIQKPAFCEGIITEKKTCSNYEGGTAKNPGCWISVGPKALLSSSQWQTKSPSLDS